MMDVLRKTVANEGVRGLYKVRRCFVAACPLPGLRGVAGGEVLHQR